MFVSLVAADAVAPGRVQAGLAGLRGRSRRQKPRTRPRLENRARSGAGHRCRERAILYLWCV